MITAPSSASMTARKSGRNGPAAPSGGIRAAEAPGHPALAASLGEEKHLLPAAVQTDRPALGIGEPDAVQRLQLHQLSVASADVVFDVSAVERGVVM
jgi:hypothetical protein